MTRKLADYTTGGADYPTLDGSASFWILAANLKV